jgi:hypothetical protein
VVTDEQIQIARTSKQIHDVKGNPTPNKHGKHAMFAVSSSVGLFMLGKAVEQSGYATVGKVVKALGAVAGIGAYFLSRKARRQYQSELAALTATTS